jgi:hypothetical protein
MPGNLTLRRDGWMDDQSKMTQHSSEACKMMSLGTSPIIVSRENRSTCLYDASPAMLASRAVGNAIEITPHAHPVGGPRRIAIMLMR